MAGPARRRLERGELARALATLLGGEVERGVWDCGRSRTARVDVEHREAVVAQRKPVGLAPQPDRPRGVAGQLDDHEARDLVALGQRTRDLERPAVPRG